MLAQPADATYSPIALTAGRWLALSTQKSQSATELWVFENLLTLK